MGFRKSVLGSAAAALLLWGCADDTVSADSSNNSIVGTWKTSMVMNDTASSSMGKGSVDMSFTFSADQKLTTSMLIKQLIDDMDGDGKDDTLNQEQVTAFFAAFGATNPTVVSGEYRTEGTKLITTMSDGDSVHSDTTEFSVNGNRLTCHIEDSLVTFTRQ